MPRSSIELVRADSPPQCASIDLAGLERDVTEDDLRLFREITAVELTAEQRERILTPPKSYPRQREILAVHWHPEFVPLELIRRRLELLYPNAEQRLIIPTQHNELLEWDDFAGVEVDCYSSGFNRKVQLLLHFHKNRLDERSHVLRGMLAHTFKYRSSQLFEYMDTLTEDAFEERRQKAANETGADAELVEFCGIYTVKLREMLEQNWTTTTESMVMN